MLAEQAFLDREEEILRNRQNELMRSEQLLNEVSSTSSHPPATTDMSSSSEFYNPFSDRYGQDVSSFFDAQDNSEHSDNTAILIENHEDQPSSTTAVSGQEMMSSSELKLPTVSQQVETSSQATTDTTEDDVLSLSHANSSDSEESWDAVSDNEWSRSHADNSERRNSIRSISDTTSFAGLTDDEESH